FQVPLTRMGTDLYENLTSGNTGIGVRAQLTYQGLMPAKGFKVTVSWDQLRDYFSKDERIRASVSYSAFFGLVRASASYEKQNSEIREALEQHKCIKVEVIEGTGFTLADADKYLQPLLARINQELLDDTKPPEKIDPANAPR